MRVEKSDVRGSVVRLEVNIDRSILSGFMVLDGAFGTYESSSITYRKSLTMQLAEKFVDALLKKTGGLQSNFADWPTISAKVRKDFLCEVAKWISANLPVAAPADLG